jgi:hypothetical protein
MTFDRREMARDLMGLGSVPFLVIVVVRVAMVGNFLELFHILAAVTLFGLAGAVISGLHYHTGRIIIMAIFTSVFYDDVYFTAFATLIAVGSVLSFARYLNMGKIYTSAALALACCLASYLISIPLPIRNVY